MGGKSKSNSTQATTASTQNLNAQGNTAPLSVPSIEIKSGKYLTADVDLQLDQSKEYTVLDNVGNQIKQVDNSQSSADITKTVTTTHSTTTTDHGATAAAARTAGQGINLALETSLGALDYYDKVNSRALDKMSGVMGDVMKSNSLNTSAALSFADGITRTDDSQNFNYYIKWAAVAAAGYLILKVS